MDSLSNPCCSSLRLNAQIATAALRRAAAGRSALNQNPCRCVWILKSIPAVDPGVTSSIYRSPLSRKPPSPCRCSPSRLDPVHIYKDPVHSLRNPPSWCSSLCMYLRQVGVCRLHGPPEQEEPSAAVGGWHRCDRDCLLAPQD